MNGYFAESRLKSANIPYRFCTNESQLSQKKIYDRLASLGIPLTVDQVFSPIPAAKKYVEKHDLRPYTIVHKDVGDEFKEFTKEKHHNCVLIGDATDNFSYDNVDEAFRILLQHPTLLTMGYGYFSFHMIFLSNSL